MSFFADDDSDMMKCMKTVAKYVVWKVTTMESR